MQTELLFRTDPTLPRCEASVTAVEGRFVRLDRTVFYPTGGGQPGDIGTFSLDGRTFPVVDTIKGDTPDDVIHMLADEADHPFRVGTTVTAAIDWPRRQRHMRMHTALHLLCAVIEGDVTGGQIGAERSRLDFNLPSGVLDKDELTARLNELIAAAHPVEQQTITAEELEARPELVRTMSVKPPTHGGRVRLVRIGPVEAPVDLQPCGGTHVANTAEIGRVEVAKIENKGRQNRRVYLVLADG